MDKMAAGSAFLMLNVQALAAVQSKAVEFKDADATLTGCRYRDNAVQGPRPGVLVTDQRGGLDDHAKRRASMPAVLGHVAFGADISGDGRVTGRPDQVCVRPFPAEIL